LRFFALWLIAVLSTELPDLGVPRAGRRSAGFRLILVALPVLAPADVPLRGVDGTVDLLVVLMVGVALGEPRHFVDPLSACSGCSSA
jgi:hypothetical protein